MAPTWVKQIFWTLAGSGLVYVAAVLCLTIPTLQRNATYAHNINPARWQNLTNVEQFGFLHHQIQPFSIKSTDNVTLYAWHILPTHLYRKHKDQLVSQSDFGVKPFEQAANTVGLRLLLDDPNAKVVISFHGNAAHLGFSQRSTTYQQFLGTSTSEQPVHVIAFDYRGFGLSTGTPSEQGVIDDGLSIVSAFCGSPTELAERNRSPPSFLSHASLNPSQIILVGQSMGTFVATATLHKWTIDLQQAPFKALVLLASFSNLPKLLDSYSIKGWTPPLLSPLTQYPWAQKWLRGRIVDKWDTATRLKDLVRQENIPLNINIMHARDDWEIPYREGYMNWLAVQEAANGTGIFSSTHDDIYHPEFTKLWRSDDGSKTVKWQKVRHGHHNRIPTSEHVKLVLYDILDDEPRVVS